MFESLSDFWIWNLFLNVLGYGMLVFPSYLLIQHLKRINYKENGNQSKFYYSFLVKCVYGDEPYEILPTANEELNTGQSSSNSVEESFAKKAFKLMFCAIGLQTAYLTWGVLQERIMTQSYGEVLSGDGQTVIDAGAKFGNSQFLVFVNRVLALLVAWLYIKNSSQPRTTVPTYKYSYCSLSNVMSSWFQYEALKYVSFPTQVLGKACKVIPVMIMGKFVSGNKYSWFEWFTALLLSIGVSFFLFGTPQDTSKGADSTGLSGLLLMVGYMGFDSFTSNWQGQLFKEYKMSSFQMMLGVNLFSTTFTLGSLIQRGDFLNSIAFMLTYGEFMWHCIILSICSAVGQLFIYYTIGQFGAVVFIIIMTTRQALAILLSCVIYGHPVTAVGLLGILTVFLALGLRIHNTWAKKKKEAASKAQS